MDDSDSKITFNENGECDHCQNFDKKISKIWKNDNKDSAYLDKVAKKIKLEGVAKDFDCIIGISGGLDSSYTAYVAKEVMGLNPLLYHVDAGWNSQQAVHNIESIVDKLDLDLYTEVINWEIMG